MRSLQIATISLAAAGAVFAQAPRLTVPPSGNAQKSSVTQYIGPVSVTIDYSSPAVHSPSGEDRRGQIWGKLVAYGLTTTPFGNGKPAPWRAGANENTVLTVSDDVTINGKPLPAGRYGLHMIAQPDEWTLILSRNSSAWGSFFYEESEDALRVAVKPVKHDYTEWLNYEFVARRPAEATVQLQWEDIAVPWTIKVPNINEVYISHLRKELTGAYGFDPEAYAGAAQFCVQNNTNLEEALKWIEIGINRPFIGQANFNTLSTKAQVLSKLGREQDAKETMLVALRLPGTTSVQIHQYGRQLITEKKNQEALAIFKLNVERFGDAWPTNVGMARGYAAVGDNQKALEYAKKALAQAPDDLNKQSLEAMVKTLSEGKPLAQ